MGRIYLMMIGLMLAAAGGFFCWLMWRSFERAHAMRSWPEVPCRVLESKMEERQIGTDSAPEFQFSIQYGYVWQGKPLTSTHWTWRNSPWTSRRDEVEMLMGEYPAGRALTCRVDPAHPEFAILKLDSQAPLYSIWFPALFVIGGLVMAGRAAFGSGKAGLAPVG